VAVDLWRTGQGLANQPWSRVVFPNPDGSIWPGATWLPSVWDAASALRVPAVSRATTLYSGLIKQCAIDAFRGVDPLARPRLLDAPDPDESRSWFVGVQVEDYLWHGNALQLVTSRSVEGWPLSVAWVPASWVSIIWHPGEPRHRYMVGATELPFEDVIHVRRSADRRLPVRGVGVIEQHLSTFDRAAMEEDYERSTLSNSGVPSVAIVTPNPSLSQEEADDGAVVWDEKFGGPVRRPAILPYGTTVIPLGWSPADSQMIEARKMTLLDVANAFNLDGYWLGAPTTSLTYRSPGPLYLGLLRTSLEPVLSDFEGTWSRAWLPRGQSLRFDRLQLTRDDFLSTLPVLTDAVGEPILTHDEARHYLGLARAGQSSVSLTSPVDTTEVPVP
jgi:HK97 family phage portal protein